MTMLNQEMQNNSGQTFIVLDERKVNRVNSKGYHRQVLVQFKDTGTTKWVYRENATKGKVNDPYAVSVYGLGYTGEADRNIPYYKQAKQLWRNMMKRCYSTKDKKGYYGFAFVCTRWHCFENFINDLPQLENFDLWLSKENGNYNLDKDKYGDGKYYSKENCCFITEHENKSLGGKADLSRYKRTLLNK